MDGICSQCGYKGHNKENMEFCPVNETNRKYQLIAEEIGRTKCKYQKLDIVDLTISELRAQLELAQRNISVCQTTEEHYNVLRHEAYRRYVDTQKIGSVKLSQNTLERRELDNANENYQIVNKTIASSTKLQNNLQQILRKFIKTQQFIVKDITTDYTNDTHSGLSPKKRELY